MNGTVVFYAIVWSVILLFAGHWIFNKLAMRYSPRYVAKQKLKLAMRFDRSHKQRQQRTEDEKARLLAWAEAHPDDTVAKELLARKKSIWFVSSISTSTDEFDPQAQLRREQQIEDNYEREQDARIMHVHQMHEWALANPHTVEGRRHLGDMLNQASTQLEVALYNMRLDEYYVVEDNSLEAIETATRVADASRRKVEAERLIERIRAALESVSSEHSQH